MQAILLTRLEGGLRYWKIINLTFIVPGCYLFIYLGVYFMSYLPYLVALLRCDRSAFP